MECSAWDNSCVNGTAHQAPQSPSHTRHYKVVSAPCSWINPYYTELPIRQNRNNLSPQLGQGRCQKRFLTSLTGAPSLSRHEIALFHSVLLIHGASFNFIIQQGQGSTPETAPLHLTPYLGGAKDLQCLPDTSHTATDVKRLQKRHPILDHFHKTSECVCVSESRNSANSLQMDTQREKSNNSAKKDFMVIMKYVINGNWQWGRVARKALGAADCKLGTSQDRKRGWHQAVLGTIVHPTE